VRQNQHSVEVTESTSPYPRTHTYNKKHHPAQA